MRDIEEMRDIERENYIRRWGRYYPIGYDELCYLCNQKFGDHFGYRCPTEEELRTLTRDRASIRIVGPKEVAEIHLGWEAK